MRYVLPPEDNLPKAVTFRFQGTSENLKLRDINDNAMKTLFTILFLPVRILWRILVFIIKLTLIVCTFGLITMMDS